MENAINKLILWSESQENILWLEKEKKIIKARLDSYNKFASNMKTKIKYIENELKCIRKNIDTQTRKDNE